VAPLIVWLWDAAGASGFARGVSGDEAGAREAARVRVASGSTGTAIVQAARLVDDPDAIDSHYVRFGSRWQASRTRAGTIRWREIAAGPASCLARVAQDDIGE
jgi:hypothetical protein